MKRLLRAAKRRLITFPVFPLLNLPFRAFDTWRRYIGPVVGNWLRWLFASRADSNFTYHLTAHCRTNLAASVAGLLGKNFAEIETYFQEIENDQEFDAHPGIRVAKVLAPGERVDEAAPFELFVDPLEPRACHQDIDVLREPPQTVLEQAQVKIAAQTEAS